MKEKNKSDKKEKIRFNHRKYTSAKWIALLVFFLTAIPFLPAQAAELTNETMISFWGENLSTNYSVRDITYPDKAKGFNSSGIYQARKKVVKEGGSFLSQKSNYLEIKSKAWKEAAPDPYYAYYQNTTEFYWTVANGDYEINVILVNPTLKSYNACLRSGTQEQSEVKTLSPGKEEKLTGQISAAEGELSFSIVPETTALSEKKAAETTIYVKSMTITPLAAESKGKNPTIYIAGDSTSAYYDSSNSPWEGWGQEFYRYFDRKNTVSQKSQKALGFNTDYLDGYRRYTMSDITIENWSVPGESTKTFLESGKWDGILNKVCPGDYVFVQFGHNDSVKNKGIKYASLTTYKKNLNYFVKSCKQRGATCVLLSPIPKCTFTSGGTCKLWINNYRTAMKSVAASNNVPFLDIGSYGASFLTNIGKTNAEDYYLIVPKGKYTAFAGGKKTGFICSERVPLNLLKSWQHELQKSRP